MTDVQTFTNWPSFHIAQQLTSAGNLWHTVAETYWSLFKVLKYANVRIPAYGGLTLETLD